MRRPERALRLLRLGSATALAASVALATAARSVADGPPRPLADGEPRSLPAASLEHAIVDAPATEPAGRAPKAVASVEGLASPGLRLTLRGSGSEGIGLSYRWIQSWGPEAELDDPDGADPTFVVPRAAGTMVFVLIVRNAEGVDSSTVRVPIRWEGHDPSPPGLVADAGDDLIARVGRQVTLNGIRSAPRGEVGYRWIQVGGPPVELAIADGYVYTFVPTAPGSYRFALVVASANAISEPDYVRVDVETAGASAGPSSPAAALGSGPAGGSIEGVAASALAAVAGGPELGAALAGAFEGVAGRMELYESPEQVFREIALRLDAVLPPDPGAREGWNARVLGPISAAVIADLAPGGLDLSRAGAMASGLSPIARAELADRLLRIAAGFRSASPGGRDLGANPTDASRIDRASATPEQEGGIR